MNSSDLFICWLNKDDFTCALVRIIGIDENLKEATVRNLLTMCLGQEKDSLMGEHRPFYEEDNWVKMSLAIPFKYKPGTHFVYNNVGPYLAGILVQRRSECDLVSYLTPRLFSKLGIKRPT